MSSTYDIVLNIEKILDTYANVPDLAGAVDRGIQLGLKDFEGQLRTKVKDNMESYGVGSLITQITLKRTEEGILLRLHDGETDYAMFIEYGTGIVGESNPHPDPSRANWIYDIDNHGDEGWWYPTDSNDPNPTAYESKNGGWWAWTAGQRSRPFMYDTWLWAKRSFNNTVRSHILKELKKLEGRY